jgi:hypothetical protein
VNNFTIQLFVQIFDSTNVIATYYITSNLTVQVNPNPLKTLVDELLSGIHTLEIAFQLENTADLKTSSSIIVALVSALNNLENRTYIIV